MSLASRRALLGTVMLVASAPVGCVATPEYMRASASTVPSIDAASATVVFVRPSSAWPKQLFRVWTTTGRFVGESRASSWFSARIAPGRHVFVGVAGDVAPLVADLAPGRLYFVEVASKMGAWSRARVELLRLAPSTERWPLLREWLADGDAFEPDVAGGQAWLDGDVEDRDEAIRRAHEALAGYDAEALAARTLRGDDGVTRWP